MVQHCTIFIHANIASFLLTIYIKCEKKHICCFKAYLLIVRRIGIFSNNKFMTDIILNADAHACIKKPTNLTVGRLL